MLEQDFGIADHVEQCGRGWLVLLQPFVHGALDRPGDFAQFGETNHATAALQGMESSSHRHQRFATFHVQTADLQIAAQRLQHFARLLEEDLQQFFILAAGAYGHACRNRDLFRRRWRFAADGRTRLGDVVQHGAQCGRIGFLPVRQAVDVFLQRADRDGHGAHLAGGRRLAVHITFDHLAQYGHQLHGDIQRKDVQPPLHLAQQPSGLGQLGAFGGVVEKGIQALFDGLQVALHLAGQRHHRFMLFHLAVQRDQVGELAHVFRHAHHA